MTSEFADAHAELTRALDRNELVLAYQPILDLRDGTLGGVEALLRWNHPTRGLLWPGDFLGAVSDDELWSRLGGYVIEEAARQASAWRSQAPGRAFPVAINVSGSHFEGDDLVVQLAHAQRTYDLESGMLALEVGERTLFTDVGRNRTRLESLKHLGAQVVVDDFGTGYAAATDVDAPEQGTWRVGATDGLLLSLVALEDFSVDIIAIDRRLLERLFTGAGDAALVHAIVRMAHRFGFRVLAEGVETSSEADQLRRAGCDLAQGYYFHRPQSPAYIEILLREAREARREEVLRKVQPV
ncbi:MAG TPA: EAL domain-containing protein [Acidimicrobiia bacterium]|jgi:EAL domain-containing protein (putative c-di-GMP-specific phosphodiesterase class I)